MKIFNLKKCVRVIINSHIFLVKHFAHGTINAGGVMAVLNPVAIFHGVPWGANKKSMTKFKFRDH